MIPCFILVNSQAPRLLARFVSTLAPEYFQRRPGANPSGHDQSGEHGATADDEQGNYKWPHGDAQWNFKDKSGETPRCDNGEQTTGERGQYSEREIFHEEDAADLLSGSAQSTQQDAFLHAR